MFKKMIFVLAFSCIVSAQPQCSQSLNASATGRQAAITNKANGCNTWTFQYWTSNVASISIEVDTANDNGSGAPGSWSAVTPVILGPNPNTALFGLIQFQTFAPFLSVQINTYTTSASPNSVNWTLFGAAGITAKVIPSTGANTFLSNLTSPTAINQNLLFSPDATFNIGAAGATRPAAIFMTGNLNTSNGGVSAANGTVTGNFINGTQYQTASNCASSSGACSSAAAGTVSVAAAATTVTVTTSAVHAASEIALTNDATKGAALGVTCNTSAPGFLSVTTITAGTSFVITDSVAPSVNPQCIDYVILN